MKIFILVLSCLTLTVHVCKTVVRSGTEKATVGVLNQQDWSLSENTEGIPSALSNLRNVHPRLYMTAESQKILRSKMTDPTYAAMLGKLKAHADRAVKRGAPAYKPGSGYDEQLWQREVGNAIPELAMTYCMTGIPEYLEAAKSYMLASASYPTWGIGDIDNKDLATGHQLYGLALGYDWLFADLDEISRDSIRNCLIKRGGRLYELLKSKKVWWHNAYLHNHQHVSLTGLAAAGLALYDGLTDVDGWIMLPLQKYRQVVSTFPSDGGWHEGIPYSGYAIEYIMKFMDLSRDLLGEDLFQGNPFFRNLAGFRLYAMIPQDYWTLTKSTLMTMGDSPRTDWYGPDYLLRKVASEYKDGIAQWLANKIDSAAYSSPQAYFLNLLWYDHSVKPVSPEKLPETRHFNDLDIVYMRSGWDGKESVSMFKCGPHIGHNAISKYNYDPYGGHTHPDAGSFQIFSHGDWLITDEGYAWKRTAYQNTLVVNGKGQYGEGRWFSGRKYIGASELPRIIYNNSNDVYDYTIGDAKPAYPSSTRLTMFNRHILYLKPDCWVIADEVAADSSSLFEFYYHSNLPFKPDGKDHFVAAGGRGSMSLTVLKPDNASEEAFLQEIEGTGGGIANRLNVLKVSSKNKTNDLFITVIEAYPSGKNPKIKPSVSASKKGQILILSTKDHEKKFKIDINRADKRSPLFTEIR